MPFTLNGIGTRYVGKRNLLARAGACGQCGRWATLESFDTREWFVLAFIPFIPLSRYHILDECDSCKRHLRVRAAVWEAQQAEALLGAQSLLRQRPGDARTAIDAHQALAACQLTQDAAELEAAMGREFGGDAEVLVYLGQVADAAGRSADALHSYERAHLADPANATAREALALRAVQSGRLERGLELLRPVLASKTLQGAGAGCALASALVAARRFEEAQRVLRALLERFPVLGNVKRFARELAQCEKALGLPRTTLAATRDARLRWIVFPSAAALAVAAFLWADATLGAKIQLYVVESAPGTVQISIPGAQQLEFHHSGVQLFEMPAGTYRAQVSGAVQREVAFTLRHQSWPHLFDDDLNVLDATGTAVLAVEQAVYSRGGTAPGGSRKFLFGRDLWQLAHIDFAFKPFPSWTSANAWDKPERKMRVDLVDAPLRDVVYGLIADKDARPALELATWSVDHDPQSDAFLDCYVAAVRAAHAQAQAAKFLAPRLEKRPVDLRLHQAWIALFSDSQKREQSRALYRELHEREPAEPAWPFLLASLSPRISERRELLGPIATDDADSEVLDMLAEAQAAAGEWPEALATAERAGELGLRLDALYALGRTAQIDEEFAALFAKDPCNLWFALRTFERLAPGTSDAELVRSLTEWQQRGRANCPDFDGATVVYVHAWCAFTQGDIATLVRLDAGTADHSLRWLLASALADKGRLIEAQQYLDGKLRCEPEPYDALALALVCRAGGDPVQGAAWEARALPALVSPVDAEVARLLAGSRRGVANEALDLALMPWRKALVLALLSLSDEQARVPLLDLALRLQARAIFPRRIIEELAAKAVPR